MTGQVNDNALRACRQLPELGLPVAPIAGPAMNEHERGQSRPLRLEGD
jgi:hypothetical protein